MNYRSSYLTFPVKIMTLLFCLAQMGCSLINSRFGESCKWHANVQLVLEDYINKRFPSHSPVRMAVIPYSTQANLSAYNVERPGVGNEMAWTIQKILLSRGIVPIVEVLNRQDWPGKKEEFFTGNHGAIAQAREAGYDLLMVGYVEPARSLDRLVVQSKLIEAESGITIWYGTVETWSRRKELNQWSDRFWLDQQRPDLNTSLIDELAEKSSKCTVSALLDDQVVPQ